MQIDMRVGGGIAGALLGLVLSFLISPTIAECKLFTACHQLNAGYQVVSIFSTDISSEIADEQRTLQIAHSVALTVVFASAGFFAGAMIRRQNTLAGPKS